MLATGCQNLGRLNRKLSEVLSVPEICFISENIADTFAKVPIYGLALKNGSNQYCLHVSYHVTFNAFISSCVQLHDI